MTLELSEFADQMRRIEQALRSQESAAFRLSPLHAKRQPVHVLYGGAHLFTSDYVEKVSRIALAAFKSAADDGLALKALLRQGWEPSFALKIYQSVLRKLHMDPLEDYRIDFEDGYGVRPDSEEDSHAVAAARALREACRAEKASALVGVRIKSFSIPNLKRSLRTLVLFTDELFREGSKGTKLGHLIVTLPKVTLPEQVQGLVEILEKIESKHKLSAQFFKIELLIEAPEALISHDGAVNLPRLLSAAHGRCTGLHFGVYDFTSSIGVGSAGQALDHETCDAARFIMQVTAGLGRGVSLSDGIINVLPLPVHRAAPGQQLSKSEILENERVISEAWRLNYDQMLRSLRLGFHQGWDLHPAQVAIRHVANHVYVWQEFPSAAKRLNGFLERAAQATRLGATFDDRASAVGLVQFIERAQASGIIKDSDLHDAGVNTQNLKTLA